MGPGMFINRAFALGVAEPGGPDDVDFVIDFFAARGQRRGDRAVPLRARRSTRARRSARLRARLVPQRLRGSRRRPFRGGARPRFRAGRADAGRRRELRDMGSRLAPRGCRPDREPVHSPRPTERPVSGRSSRRSKAQPRRCAR